MSNEKMKILEMIEKKIISPEEGLKLLTALDTLATSEIVSEEALKDIAVSLEEEADSYVEKLEEEMEDLAEEMEDLADDLEEEVEDILDDLEDQIEEMVGEVRIESELEEKLKSKIDEIKLKASEIKNKFMSEFEDADFSVSVDVPKEQFKDDMKNWKDSLKFEMKGLNKEAKRFGREMSKLGKETATLTKDVVNDVLNNINIVDPSKQGKDYNEDDFIMEEDKETRNYNLAQEFSIDCEGKNDISINVISTDVTVITENREDILVNYIRYSQNDEDNFQVVVEEDSKRVRISEKKEKKPGFNFNFSSSAKELVVRLPHKYKESLSVKTVSGDLDLNYLDSDFFRFSSVSGDIEADIIYSVNSLIKTTSGDCEIGLFRGNMMFSTVSGDIDLKYEILDGDFNMKSVSGDAVLGLPNNSEFEVVAKSLSGDVECDFPITIIGTQKRGRLRGQVGSDANTISITTTSGDLNIEKY